MSARQWVRRALSGAFAVILAFGAWGLVGPRRAWAGWPLEGGESRVVLPFGATYPAGDGTAQHRGVDLDAAAGARVVAPLAGHITFVGRIPGVGGGRVLAVTIETARGKITLLPLASAAAAAGADLAEGALLGTLAADGDGSSSEAHLHVGAREGDLYIDPLGFMTPAAVPSDGDEGSGAEVGAGAGVAAGGGVVVSGGTAGISAGGHAPATGGMPAGVSLAPRASVATPAKGRAGRSGRTAPIEPTRAEAAYTRGSSAAAKGAASTGGQAIPLVVGPGGVFMPAATQSGTGSAGGGASLVAWLLSAAKAYAARAVKLAALVLLGVLAGIGALWPLWRGGEGKGTSQLRVRGVGDDVAAAPSR